MSKDLDPIYQKAWAGERLSPEEGEALFAAPLPTLAALADHRRKAIHHHEVVTFVIDYNLMYTNSCYVACKFCAFYRNPKDTKEVYLVPNEEMIRRIQRLVDAGGTTLLIQGGVNPDLDLAYYTKLFSDIKKAYPQLYIHSLSATEIDHVARKDKLPVHDVLQAMQAAGLDSLPGASELLVDGVREKISPLKIPTARWLEIMETAHAIGMESTATMTFGFGESFADRIEHLCHIRSLQDKTGKVRAFIPWTFTPEHTELAHLSQVGGYDYLRTLAISRLMLDNVKHLHAGWVTEGHRLAQIALSYGANDLGGTLLEEEVVSATGVRYQTTPDDIIRLIQNSGKIPAQRNSKYEIIRTFEQPTSNTMPSKIKPSQAFQKPLPVLTQ